VRRVFVDTSAWYALIDRDDQGHECVARFVHDHRGRLVTTDYVFDETVTLLRMRLGHEAAVKAGEHMRSSRLVDLTSVRVEDQDESWRLFRRFAYQRFSFTDCTSFAVMKRLGLREALTLDGHFRVAGFELVGSDLDAYIPGT
jgi:uncharacterized protein